MKIYITLGVSLLLTLGTTFAQCSGTPRSYAHLGWSEPANIIAPNYAWRVEVRPVFGTDENQTPVTLHRCGSVGSWPLFTLKRDAELHWGANGRQLLVINEPLSGSNELLLFSVARLTTGTQGDPPGALDRVVTKALTELLGKERRVQFYLPTFVSWKDDDLLLAVGGETTAADVGPMTGYCYGMRVNSSTLRVESVLSEKELKARTGHTCRVFP